MKIFAKRKRTAVDSDEARRLLAEQREAAKNEIEVDKAVEELLTLDPASLNAKQRRMVKRYKQRDLGTNQDEATPISSPKENATVTTSAPVLLEEPPPDKVDNPDQAMPSSTQKKIASVSASAPGPLEETPADKVDSPDTETSEKEEESKVSTKNTLDENAGEKAQLNEPTEQVDEAEVKKLLEQLNSKQRRKLMRRLERDGDAALVEVHQEALSALEASKEERTEQKSDEKVKNGKQVTESKDKESEVPSRKKRKLDLSNLPPEERLRREEQRRRQQEAAERRANGETGSQKRHPLNSERRRANRRKPKWSRKHPETPENEHDSSGYHLRKVQKTDK